MKTRSIILKIGVIIIFYIILPFSCYSELFLVGPAYQYKKPSQVMNLVKDGDTVDIQAGIYSADVGKWTANNLLIRGVGGMAHMKADGAYSEGKGIWVIKGKNTTVEYIEFSGSKVPDKNGAGIRQESDGLILRYCYFHDNENGVLTSASATSDIIFEFCEFNHNGYGDGFTHNMYIGHIRSFTIRYSYTHHAEVGHNIKSRAGHNTILFNRIADELTGASSMQIDLPNGGLSLIMGNVIIEGPNSSNRSMFTYGLEKITNADSNLYVVNNTFVSKRSGTTYANLQPGTKAIFYNNIFTGSDAESKSFILGNPELKGNLQKNSLKDILFRDADSSDFHLMAGSPAIDAGYDASGFELIKLTPLHEYKHPNNSIARFSDGKIDIGAFEFSSPIFVESQNSSLMTIAPNPFSEFITIHMSEFADKENLVIIIYNILGDKILEIKPETGENIIKISSSKLISGCYLVSMQSGEQKQVQLVFKN
jgi:hypothetical protein